MLSHRRGSSAARGRGHRSSVVVALLLLLSSAGMAQPVSAVTPSPTIVDPGDPRSEGEGAGLVGDPILVAVAVIGLGLLASASALVYLRLGRDE